jgi:VIT1/CCC1 family predicted Fe2+/Mn2+ transporter
MEHDHTSEAIKERLAAGPYTSYLRDWIYGGIDGAVTTFAVVSGVVGAELSTAVILVLGAANLIADGFSMAASNFTGTRAEREEHKRLEAIEWRHISENPEGEREEIRQIYALKGLEGAALQHVVKTITSDRNLWVRTMLTEEYGLPSSVRSPLLAALSTFSAFLVCGFVPILPFVFDFPHPFLNASVLTGAVFAAIGCFKSRWSVTSWWKSGVETLAIGAAAAALAYLAGYLLRSIVSGG